MRAAQRRPRLEKHRVCHDHVELTTIRIRGRFLCVYASRSDVPSVRWRAGPGGESFSGMCPELEGGAASNV